MALRVINELNRSRTAAWLGRALITLRATAQAGPKGLDRDLADSLIREVATLSETVREHLAARLRETPELSTLYSAEATQLLALLSRP